MYIAYHYMCTMLDFVSGVSKSYVGRVYTVMLLVTKSNDNPFDSEGDYGTGCRNASHCQQKQSYSGLRSRGQSYSTYLWKDPWVQTFHSNDSDGIFRKSSTAAIFNPHFIITGSGSDTREEPN